MGDLWGIVSSFSSSLISMPVSPKSRIIRSLDSRGREDSVFQIAVSIFNTIGGSSKKRRPLREKWISLWLNHTCETVYQRRAEMAVKLILDARQLVPEYSQINNEIDACKKWRDVTEVLCKPWITDKDNCISLSNRTILRIISFSSVNATLQLFS